MKWYLLIMISSHLSCWWRSQIARKKSSMPRHPDHILCFQCWKYMNIYIEYKSHFFFYNFPPYYHLWSTTSHTDHVIRFNWIIHVFPHPWILFIISTTFIHSFIHSLMITYSVSSAVEFIELSRLSHWGWSNLTIRLDKLKK